MKARFCFGAAICLLIASASPIFAQNHQLLQGTQIHLTLLNGLSTSVAHNGDPFTAIVADPVLLGNQLILPAGARVNGTISSISRPRRFNMFRGQAAINVTFHSIEIDHHEYPAQMSLLSISDASGHPGAGRKDVKIEEGTVVQGRRDVKGAVTTVAVGMGGGSVVGVIFSNVLRGFLIGTVGSTAYVLVKKGKEVELPAQTGMLVRMDGTIDLPGFSARLEPYAPQP
jgi:hypothetical protein